MARGQQTVLARIVHSSKYSGNSLGHIERERPEQQSAYQALLLDYLIGAGVQAKPPLK